MAHTSLAYRTLLRAATVVAPLGGLLNDKLARTLALRYYIKREMGLSLPAF